MSFAPGQHVLHRRWHWGVGVVERVVPCGTWVVWSARGIRDTMWHSEIRLATPEEIATHQLASEQAGQL